ncbi:2-oxo-4-hydroxy-4-carboxy-5-ureidoimidazoline decarboxylase [Acuticoccus sp. MNP-M23]|uniref:2-oxo-4-hydroxy-4-carboxy-5-ureidoimidazoline decarboxylase n=1 Tax=Acuticoccus sp. MNP-M23 TaxID=3072793 RepID=UPI0028151DAF|nr:2-oxo-4-hydroxy-4-carboxy-5-ureidoimidazoline decarboxylase [Acuticoccus sp. MNP-M23]WMS44344.1 2-oxo-4-hydroxy-4-carboxy-5-ureidoimidazoline decarboxylase [Acuticoccus sp. MNP-M23]
MTRDDFVSRYAFVYEHSPWVAERAWDGGIGVGEDPAPVFRRVVERAGADAQRTLLRAHPDLAGRLGTALTAHSSAEQAGAGLDRCTQAEFAEFQALNTRYVAQFGFPFIIAVKGLDRTGILKAFRERVDGTADGEFRVALDEVHKIAGFRLAALAAPPAVTRTAVPIDTVRKMAFDALSRAGANEANAAAIADNIAAAERDGSESHGLFRLPGYVKGLELGSLNGAADPARLAGPDAALLVDGDGGAAPLAYARFLPQLADLASEKGAAVLALRNAVHFAAMWPEVEALAERGLAAFAATANYPYLAPHGGRRALLGTNPIAFAFPRPAAPPLVFDFASAAMARGDVMIAARDGRPVPFGVGVDKDGVPTTDPAAILGGGAQLAFGAHKGSALALMVELLAAGLVGDVFSDEAGAREAASGGLPRGGVFVLALSPERLGGPDALGRADAFLARLAAEPGVRLPGARRHARRARAEPAMVEAVLLRTVRGLAGH